MPASAQSAPEHELQIGFASRGYAVSPVILNGGTVPGAFRSYPSHCGLATVPSK